MPRLKKNSMLANQIRQSFTTYRMSVWEEKELQFLHDIVSVHCKIILDLAHADILLQLLVDIIPTLAG